VFPDYFPSGEQKGRRIIRQKRGECNQSKSKVKRIHHRGTENPEEMAIYMKNGIFLIDEGGKRGKLYKIINLKLSNH
jgi:hypothetical protein